MMNAFAMLMTSRGVPMILMGDEIGRSQHGNNNAYCIDSELTWLDWTLLNSNSDLFDFVCALVKFRLAHPALRVNNFDAGLSRSGLPSSSFHGPSPWSPDWSAQSRQLGWMFTADIPSSSEVECDVVYVIANMAHYATWFRCPDLPAGLQWATHFNTGDPAGAIKPNPEPVSPDGLLVGERSVVILAP
jgi:glycogen operon protein